MEGPEDRGLSRRERKEEKELVDGLL